MLFNNFLERIVFDELANYDPDLRFADDIDFIVKNAKELEGITSRLDTEPSRFGMETSTEKSKAMVTGKKLKRSQSR